jgi:hypothetical protein
MDILHLGRFYIILIFALMQMSAFSQSISRQVIGSFGDVKRSSDFHLSYTIGEPVSVSRSLPQSLWNIGFQQGYVEEGSSTPFLHKEESTVSLYPNPVSIGGVFMLKSDQLDVSYKVIQVIDYSGQSILYINNPSLPLVVNLPMNLLPGVYHAIISTNYRIEVIPLLVTD